MCVTTKKPLETSGFNALGNYTTSTIVREIGCRKPCLSREFVAIGDNYGYRALQAPASISGSRLTITIRKGIRQNLSNS